MSSWFFFRDVLVGEQQPGALRRRHAAPGPEGRPGAAHRPVHLVGGGEGHLAEHFLRGGVGHVDAAGAALDEPAVDEQLQLAHGSGRRAGQGHGHVGKQLVGGLRLDAERVERHRHEPVVGDGHDHAHHLARVVALGERIPGVLRDDAVAVDLVRRVDVSRLEIVPAGRGPQRDPFRLEAVIPRAPDAAHVLGPLVDRLAVPADAQNQQLAEVRRERRDAVHVPGLPVAGGLQRRIARERAPHADAFTLQRRDARLGERRLGRRHVQPVRHVGREARLRVVVRLHAPRVVEHGDQRGLVDRHHRVEQLVQIVAAGQRVPRRVAHRRVDVQLVGEAHQRRLERVPSGRVRTLRDAVHLAGHDARRAGRRHVVRPQVARLREPRRAQDQQPAVARRQARVHRREEDERHHRLDELRDAQHGPERVADAHLRCVALDERPLRVRPLGLGQRRNPRLAQSDERRAARRLRADLRRSLTTARADDDRDYEETDDTGVTARRDHAHGHPPSMQQRTRVTIAPPHRQGDGRSVSRPLNRVL